jgi:hypothetical protein
VGVLVVTTTSPHAASVARTPKDIIQFRIESFQTSVGTILARVALAASPDNTGDASV